jgi:hypothetical protein
MQPTNMQPLTVAMSMLYMRLGLSPGAAGACSTLATSIGLTTPLQMQKAAVAASCKPQE